MCGSVYGFIFFCATLSDGCSIHHSGPWWWAKEQTCGGEGEVVSEESALFDYARSIIQTTAAQKLSVCRQQPEWLLPLQEKSNALTRRKKVVKGFVGMASFQWFGEKTLPKNGYSVRISQFRRYDLWVYLGWMDE